MYCHYQIQYCWDDYKDGRRYDFYTILKSHKSITDKWHQNGNSRKKHKKQQKYDELNAEMLQWFYTMRVTQEDDAQSCIELTKIDVGHAVSWIHSSWNEIRKGAIVKCFHTCGFFLMNLKVL